jgi:hypothetical protein
MRSTTLLLLCCLGAADGAFVVPASLKEGILSSSTAMNSQMDRRTLLSGAVTTAFLGGASRPAFAEDALETFGKELGGKWPLAPSPLPTQVKSAAELTSPAGKMIEPPGVTSPEEGLQAMSDLEQMLQESSKKKAVDPRTHG